MITNDAHQAKSQFKLLGVINMLISQVGLYSAVILLVIMTSAVMLQVVSRGLRLPIGWTEEVAVMSMTWIAFLIAPYAYRRHLFTRIEILLEHLTFYFRMILLLILHILEFLILCVGLYYAWIFFNKGLSNMAQLTSLLRGILEPFMGTENINHIYVKSKWIYIIVPFGFFTMLLVDIEHIFRTITSLIVGKDLTTAVFLRPQDVQDEQEPTILTDIRVENKSEHQ